MLDGGGVARSVEHLLLVSREEFGLIPAVQVPQPDCEVVG